MSEQGCRGEAGLGFRHRVTPPIVSCKISLFLTRNASVSLFAFA